MGAAAAVLVFLHVMTDVALFACPAPRPSGCAREIRVTIDQTVNTGAPRRWRAAGGGGGRANAAAAPGPGPLAGRAARERRAGRGRPGGRTGSPRGWPSRPGVRGAERRCPAPGGLGPGPGPGKGQEAAEASWRLWPGGAGGSAPGGAADSPRSAGAGRSC